MIIHKQKKLTIVVDILTFWIPFYVNNKIFCHWSTSKIYEYMWYKWNHSFERSIELIYLSMSICHCSSLSTFTNQPSLSESIRWLTRQFAASAGTPSSSSSSEELNAALYFTSTMVLQWRLIWSPLSLSHILAATAFTALLRDTEAALVSPELDSARLTTSQSGSAEDLFFSPLRSLIALNPLLRNTVWVLDSLLIFFL